MCDSNILHRLRELGEHHELAYEAASEIESLRFRVRELVFAAPASPQPEAEAQKAVARLNVKAADDPIWPGMKFIGLTDAGRALPAGGYQLYAAPITQAVKVPLTADEVLTEWSRPCYPQYIHIATSFEAGVRFAERHHGIQPSEGERSHD